MSTKTKIGDHQEIHIGKFSMDRRGLMSGSIQRVVEEAFDSINMTLLTVDAAPTTVTLPCVGVDRNYDSKRSEASYTYSYEGMIKDPKDDQTTFELDFTMGETGVLAHPNIDAIQSKYGKFDEEKNRFRKTLPDGGLNPLFGTDSYYTFGATFKMKYVRLQIPSSALSGIGEIASPPGIKLFPLPPWASGRQWLKVAPHILRRGNCVEIEENFLMAGRHGIVKEIYGAGAMSGNPTKNTARGLQGSEQRSTGSTHTLGL